MKETDGRESALPAKRESRSYAEWVEKFDTLTPSDRIGLRRRLRELRRWPRISVLLPIYNPDLTFLNAAIESVKAQLYQNWELCLADDASTDAQVRPFLEQAATSDSRIKLALRQKNGHISAASNSALDLATGEWCALLDQDDVLAPDALGRVALEIDGQPEARLVYTDEDKIDAAGNRSSPYFKTNWDPVFFLGQNYINHLGLYHTEIIREIGGFRESFEGAQDYDLALRVTEKLRLHQVRHIPRVLYHWRTLPGSVAAAIYAKPYAKDAARRAIAEHLARCGVAAQVEPCEENTERHRVVYELPAQVPLVSFVIPTRNRLDLLKRCIADIRQGTEYERIELLIIDNGSTDESTLDFMTLLSQEKDTQVLSHGGPFNFSELINRGALAARGEILALLNDDVEPQEPGWLREMVSQVLNPGAGAVGARLWYVDQTLQHGGVILGLGGMAGHAFRGTARGDPGYFDRLFLPHNCSAVTAACMVVHKQVFQEAGGFDEEDFAVNFNDIDFCLRLRERGMQIIWTPYANLIHQESASRGRERSPEAEKQFLREAARFREKWGEQLLDDVFYNPNLSLDLPGYEIAFPPRRRRVEK